MCSSGKSNLIKLLALMFVCIMFIGAMPSVARAEESEMGLVTGDGVKMRADSNTDSAVLFELEAGTELEVITKENNGWYRVLYNDTVGYIRQDYLFVNSDGSRGAYVRDDGTMLRGGPSQESYVVDVLSAGQGVKVKALLGDWYFAVANDKVGYIHRTYLEITASTTASANMLKMGMEGAEVTKLQNELYRRGFLNKSGITGSFGSQTRTAVLEFQKAASLASADGIAGAQTLAAVYDTGNNIMKANVDFNKMKGSVVLLNWFKGGDEWLHKGARFTVVDVRTQVSFRARRFGGWYHADSEPITAADTEIIRKNIGYSWNRRPIWIIYNGKVVAASMHTMPHMANPTPSNNFDGHFCIHLLGSKVHETSKECSRHQSAVQDAYRKGR